MKKIFTFLVLMLVWAGSSWGQSVVIGSGTTTTNGSTLDPVECYYNYEHYQIIYTAAELTAAGMPAGVAITAMGFSISEVPGSVTLANYKISMGLTAQATAQPYISTLTVVKGPFTYTPTVQVAGSFDMIPFTTNFIWDGTSNIVINTCTGSNAFVSPYGGLRYTSSTSGLLTYVRTDGTDNCPNTSLTSTVERPNIQLNYVVLPPCVTPAAQPTSLILTPTTTTINGSFTLSGSADSYLVVRSLSSTLSATPVNGTTYLVGSAFGGGIVDYWGAGPAFTSTGLTPGTLYYYYIFAANSSCSGTTPNYRTTSPLTGNTTTIPVTPLTGIKTIPGDYATIAAAIAAINASGVGGGGVTFNVAPGYTETFLTPLAGYISPSLNPPTAANQVLFQKFGAGVNPKVTAPVGTSAYDAIIAFAGVNYVTFDGIDVQESVSNITALTQMEFGYAIFKVSGTQGSQNNTIKNCTITLNKTNTNIPYGIFSNNITVAAPTIQLTVTSAAGTNSNNKIFNNTITNCYGGIYMNGYNDGTFPYLYYDQNNEIGVGGANTFTNLGGGASTIYGMYLYYQNGLKVANNIFSGTLTSGVGTTVYIMYLGAATNANVDIYGNNLTFTYTGTTSSLYGIYNGFGSSGINNTVNIYNNTVTINYATATTGVQYSIYQGASTFNLNCYGNNVVNNVIGSASTVGTGTWAGIYTFGGNTIPGSFWNIYNNNVNGNSRVQSVFAAGSSYGIYNSAAGQALTVYNNNVNNNSWPSSSTAYCIYMSTSAFNMIVRKNTISGNSKPNAVVNVLPRSASLYGMYVGNSQLNNVTIVDSNNIFNQTNTWGGQLMGIFNTFGSSGTGNIYSNNLYNFTGNDQAIFGIYNSAGLVNNIYKNNLYNLSATIGDSASFYAICSGSTTPNAVTNIYNNFVSDLKAPQAVNYLSGAIYVFSGVATSTVRIYYNTVYLNQTPTLGSPATSCVYASTVPLIDMRNNIFYNNSGILGGGITIAYWRSAVSPGTYSNFSNSNCMYAGTPSATNLIYFDFTNSDQTLAAYKLRYPQEVNSVTETPPFVNVAVTPYNLHLQTTVATQCESGGQPITIPPITTDYDNQVRSVTTPDIGADEFAGIPSDQSPPTINFTPLTNGPVAVTRSFPNVTIVDPSGVNTVSGLRPRCYYKKSVNGNTFNDNTSATDGWKWVEATGTTSPFTFNINYALLSGGSVVAGDIIQYFIVAQDQAALVHVGIRLGSFTTQPATVNLAAANFPINGTIYQYSIVANSLSGIVTVGTGGTYLNLTGATGLFQAINGGVVSGSITANIISDLVEDGTNALNQWTEDIPNSNYTLTIQPSAATARLIAGTYAGGLIRLNGADRVTFNGNFSGAGSWLTFSNTAASGTVAVFQLLSLGTYQGATNNTIRNCNITGGFNTSGCYGIFAGGASIGTAGDDNDNLVIQNNSISKCYVGIWAQATATGILDNLQITGNSVGSATLANYIGHDGIMVAWANAALISQNTVFNILTTNSTPVGITISTGVSNSTISMNNINNVVYTGASGYGGRGMYINTTFPGASNLTIANNLVSVIGGDGWSSFSGSSPVGLYFDGTMSGLNIYFNSVFMSGNVTQNMITLTTCILFNTTTIVNIDLRDNIFENAISNSANAGAKNYAIYSTSPPSNFSQINYNDYFAPGTQGILGFFFSDKTTLAALQLATGKDANSVNVDPVFTSTTDLHPSAAGVAKAGIYLPSVTSDYTGVPNIRTNPPDMGAYQFSANPAVVTTAATGIGLTAATLNGTINANNAIVISGFEYGLTIAYGSSVAAVPASVTGASVTPVSAALSGLLPCTLYHFRAKGVTGALTVNGGDLTFSTLNATPVTTTIAATGVTGTTATVNGTVNANGISTTITFDYGLTIGYGSTVPGVPSPIGGVTPTAVSAALSGLLPGNTYHYRVNGSNACGTANGTDMTFITPAIAPLVVTTAATAITTTGATLNGTVNAGGASTTVTFDYGTTIAYGTTVPGLPSPVTGNVTTPVSATLVGLIANQLYHYRVNGTNSVGTTNGNDMTFLTNCPVAGPAGPITGPTQVCQGGCGYVYSVTIPNAQGYVWTLPIGGTITSGANTNTITVCYAANAVPGYIMVYGTAACGNGSPSLLAIAMNPPAAPTITGPASVCVNTTGNVYTTQAGMTNYVWSVSAGGTITAGGTLTSNTVTVTWTTTGAKTVCVNYNSPAGCPALAPVCYNVTVNALPVPTITGPGIACNNFPGNVYTTQAGMTGYTWAASAGNITGGQGTNAVTVTWYITGAQFITVNYTNASGCTAPAATIYPVTVNSGASPTITGATSLCANSGYYNYTTEAGMTAYNWATSPGGVINYGSGTNVVTVSWITAGAQWVSVNYTNSGGCSAVNPTQLNVTVNAPPAAAGTITGTSTVCGGANGVAYSIAAVTGALAYVWNLPAGATIASGSGTNSITVNFAGNASSGNITVYANNLCGNGTTSPPFGVTVTPLPADAGTITGPASVCQGATGVVYTVPPITGATGYAWTVPAGATVMSGSNTNSIIVDFSLAAVTGNITVLGINACGNGVVSPDFAVTVNAIPPKPVVTNTGTTLYSDAPTGNQWYFEGALIPGATAQTYVATQDGYYWTIVTLSGCVSDSSNHKLILTTGLVSHSSSVINIYPVPNDGRFNVSFNTASSESFSIRVYNNLGVKIYEETKVDVNGSLQKVIDLRPVPDGVYSVVFENSLGQVVKKIVVNK